MAQRRRRNKKWIGRMMFFILLVGACVICYLVWDNYLNKKEDDVIDLTVNEVEQKDDNESEENVAPIVMDEDNGKKVTQYEGNDPNTSDSLSGVITYAGAQNEKLIIRVNIDQFLENGKCVLRLKKNGVDVYEETTSIVSSASTATCEGFDVSTNEIEKGRMEIIIDVNSGDKAGLIRGEVEV